MRDAVNAALKAAMKSQDKRRLSTLRLMNAAIKDRDIAARGAGREEATEAEIRELFAKMIRQREEAGAIFAEAKRPELALGEREEIEIIREFLPRQLSEGETRSACEKVMQELGATGIKDMGRTMATLKQRYAGQLDFGEAGKLIKERLK